MLFYVVPMLVTKVSSGSIGSNCQILVLCVLTESDRVLKKTFSILCQNDFSVKWKFNGNMKVKPQDVQTN